MVEAIDEGKLRAMYINGEEMITGGLQRERVAAAFGKLDFLVVQECSSQRRAGLRM